MTTTINGKAGKETRKGASGNGKSIGKLRSSTNVDAKAFLQYLSNLADTSSFSPFSCAEPHAVAQLLKDGASLDDIKLDQTAWEVQLGRNIDYCSNCRKWIHNDGSPNVEIIRGSQAISEEKTRRAINLGDFMSPVLVPAPTTRTSQPNAWAVNSNRLQNAGNTYDKKFPPLGTDVPCQK